MGDRPHRSDRPWTSAAASSPNGVAASGSAQTSKGQQHARRENEDHWEENWEEQWEADPSTAKKTRNRGRRGGKNASSQGAAAEEKWEEEEERPPLRKKRSAANSAAGGDGTGRRADAQDGAHERGGRKGPPPRLQWRAKQ